ncbi:3-phosphoserine/phosphohydroxythreonine transaminase [Paenibacillus thalictri]|uniref:Phosphoserine aminotransferase n=1 Tax=Paenibacillus thalictri TaxID=2527873 RepID=A0A4Q9DZG0_9BACL|nr:3-phosphoserine/phosphohydroxythreonine transaminase [Paenibacillus thalictri]TBL81885.1 3-phosphoserine/phosphohydroxythreonine transaminase [Paenibacillus thalictri]
MNGNRVYNFNPGPAALPLEVLEQAKEQFVAYGGEGMSLMEMSHRSGTVEQLMEETQMLLLEALALPAGYHVLFMGGGASSQFALIPMNFIGAGRPGSYVLTGSFAEKAYEEAALVGETAVAASSKAQKWAALPEQGDLSIAANSAYVHITVNNTIEGSQYRELPDTGDVPLIGDMTSDILSCRRDLSRFAMVYAGAQKNLGPAGVTAVVIRDDFAKEARSDIPVIFRYGTYVKNRSLYNTPPVHSIYMVNLVLQWVREQGGVAALEQRNRTKAKLLYDTIDASGGFYKGMVENKHRSIMNITWRMQDEALEKRFVQESEREGFAGLAGHRSVGGMRASAYNAVPLAACEALAAFMKHFQQRHG